MGIEDWDWGWALEIGIGDWDWGLRLGIEDWDWGLRFGIWDWDWGLGIGIGDLGLGWGIWDLGLGLGIGLGTGDSILMRIMKFILFLQIILELLLRLFGGCVVAGLLKN